MWNKMITLILSLLLAVAVAGCGQKAPSSDTPTDAPSEKTTEAEEGQTLDHYSEIADQEGHVIGKIPRGVSATACDAGLFYSIFQPAENEFTATAEYRFFRTEDRKDIRLGLLSDQGYEAVFTRTELGGVIYTLAVTGNPMDFEKDTLWLLAFDPMKETMQQYKVSEYGFPYTAMASSNGRLYIMNHEQDKQSLDKIYEFDPETGKVREVLTYQNSRDSLRSVAAAEDGFYVLNLKIRDEGNELWLEHYDLSGKKVSEQQAHDVMAKAAQEINGLSRDDLQNEFGMMVSDFAVIDGRYLFYENFGITRIAVDLETEEVLFAGTDLMNMSKGSGVKMIYKLSFADDPEETPEIYAFRDGAFDEATFEPKDERVHLQSISSSPGGTWAVRMVNSDQRDPDGVDLIYLFIE